MQSKNQEVIKALLFFRLHYLFWGIDELKTNLCRLPRDTLRNKSKAKVKMKRIKIVLILLIFTSILYSQNDVEIESYNRYNQPVEDQNGRINYSKFELDSFLGMEDKDVDNPASLSSNMELNSSTGSDCEILWQDVISGTCIGNNNNLLLTYIHIYMLWTVHG